MSSMSSVANLSKYITTLPKTKTSILCMIFTSFIAGSLIFIIDPNYQFSFLEKILYGGAFGFGVFGISSIISGNLTQQWVQSLKGINLKIKHSMFLSFVSMVIICIITVGGTLLTRLFHYDFLINSVILGCVLIYGFNILVLWSTTSIGVTKSGILSFFQPIFIIVMLLIVNLIGTIEFSFGTFSLIFKVIIACLIFLIAIYSFINVIESPMRKNLGIGVLDLLSLFIAQMNEGSHSLESLFEQMGEPIETIVSIVSFKGKNGIKSLFVSPCVHPGPLGDIGGSNMPTTLANRFDCFTMISHGPSTHDFNPVSIKELDKIEDTIKKGLDNLEYSSCASKFERFSSETANVGVQFLNDGVILLTTFAPEGSDDIEFSVGLTMMAQTMKNFDVKSAVIVDCHNSFSEESGQVLPGNSQVFELLDAIDNIKKGEIENSLRVGCYENPMNDLDKTDGVGESGIKTMIIETDGQRTAYVLFDANNMEVGFRKQIMDSVKDLDIDEIEVMTTDTHSVNTLSRGYNPIGLSKRKEIIEYIKKSIKYGIEDLEEVEVACGVERIKDLKTFGPNNSTELISTISSTVAVSKIIAPIIFILAILLIIIWIFFLRF